MTDTFGNPRADELLLQLRERHGDRLPEPEHGEEWSDYLRRLEEQGVVQRFNRADSKDLRAYRKLKRLEDRGVTLVERTSYSEEQREGLTAEYQGLSATEKFELYQRDKNTPPDTVPSADEPFDTFEEEE